jgi:hypothetical protein
VTASALLTLAGFAAFCATFIVARFSRWRWHSPWVAVCLEAVAAATGRAAVIAARARHQVTVHGGVTRRGRG